MSGWTVTTQRETQELIAGGRFEKGVEVGFRTGYGVDGTVFLPYSMFTPANVSAAINARAAMLDGISNLSTGTN